MAMVRAETSGLLATVSVDTWSTESLDPVIGSPSTLARRVSTVRFTYGMLKHQLTVQKEAGLLVPCAEWQNLTLNPLVLFFV